ncbi:Cytochrome P450 [Haladaptatus litoreus]|uniref:Cytochrome P450 n=1 Tax=Haladaptatus litoreus TaxID=553468 RepID=A0A1N6Y9U7_9EURY|nr:cytochrome P450 [Haladaptatus litoreus]SIR11357.1 Cytochrome P450 [Haladaptatus litoreus]
MSTLPPGPSGLPVAGSTLSFVRDPFSTYERWAEEYGDIVATNIAGRTFVMVAHPEHIERILVTDQQHYGKGSFQRDQLGDIVGDGLLLSEGEFWHEQRNRLQPEFFREQLTQYATMMVDETRARADNWTSGETITLNSELQHLTLAIMARTLFGFDIEDAEGQFANTARTISERFNLSHVSTYLAAWIPTPRNRRYRRAMNNLDTVIYDVIEARRAQDDSPNDLLATLIAAVDDPETDLTDETLRDEIATVILGGHDTAALAMTYTLTALARHPDAEAEVRAELDEVLGDDDPTVTDLPALPRLDAAVKEAMRLHPPAYTLFRESNRPMKIGEYDVPEGATLTIPQWVVHHDSRWFESPWEYQPDRWTDEFEASLPEYAYFPFCGGKRHCIGMRYGLMETKLVVATLLQRFRFDFQLPELSFAAALTLQPAEPVSVRVTTV